MKKTPHLPNNSRPSYTGQGLTDKQKRFFKQPKSMSEIIDFFGGDQWEANNFQNRFLVNAVLQIDEQAQISLIDWDAIDKAERKK